MFTTNLNITQRRSARVKHREEEGNDNEGVKTIRLQQGVNEEALLQYKYLPASHIALSPYFNVLAQKYLSFIL